MGQNSLSFLSNAALNSSDSQWRSFDETVSISENSYVTQSVTSMINQKESSPNDSMIGLELGKRTYFGVPGSMNNSNINGGQIINANSNSKVTTQKRPRISTLNPKCQVEGCKSDLSSVKDYHRRHKVCPLHSKSAMVIVSGQEQRFCQQCSRFHGLIEFDEGKRSCRRRLAGHNERRRKPQPDSFSLNTRFLPAFQDNRRFGRLFSDRYLVPDEKMQAMSAPWDDSDGSNGERKGLWLSSSSPPRMMTTMTMLMKYEEQSSSSSSPLPCSMPTSGMGIDQLFLAGLQRQNERRLHYLPQNLEKAGLGEMPKASCYGSMSPLMHQSLSLVSSSSEGLEEAIPLRHHGFARVSDSSGCALSLQSTMQHLCSAQASAAAAESLDSTSGLISSDHDLQSNSVRNASISTGEPLLLAQQTAPEVAAAAAQNEFGWANDDHKLLFLPPAITSSHDASNSRKAGDVQFSHDDLSSNGDCIRLYSMLHGGGEIQGVDGMPEDVKPTIDLMHAACIQHGQSSKTMASVAASSSSASPFEIGACQFGDLQAFRSYGPSIFSSQHI